MDNQKSILKSIKNIDKENFGSSFYKKLKLFAWETGLGPVINVRPDVLGQQAVFYFPGRSGKLSCPCFEKNGKVLLALTEKELESIRGSPFTESRYRVMDAERLVQRNCPAAFR